MKSIAITSYIVACIALLLSSCSQEDSLAINPESNDRRIVFHTSLPELSTKATEIVTKLNYFRLTVFDESNDELITYGQIEEYIDTLRIENSSDSEKIVSDKCLWPKKGHESDILHFFAFYPEVDKLGEEVKLVNASTVEENNKKISYKIDNFQVANDISKQVDFVTAYATGSMAKNLFSGVNLAFEHKLSRIEVKAWGANHSFDIEIAGVRIGGVGVRGKFNFNPSLIESVWSGVEKGTVEYIFQEDEETIKLSKNNASHSKSDDAVSIMGKGGSSMLIPCDESSGWNYKDDKTNIEGNMYISVLLRVIDANGVQQYPKNNTDQDTGSDEKEFGWAALPITGNWMPGYIYTYTLDYSYGVGLHEPNDDTHPGESIISDKVLVNVEVKDWKDGDSIDDVKVPRK